MLSRFPKRIWGMCLIKRGENVAITTLECGETTLVTDNNKPKHNSVKVGPGSKEHNVRVPARQPRTIIVVHASKCCLRCHVEFKQARCKLRSPAVGHRVCAINPNTSSVGRQPNLHKLADPALRAYTQRDGGACIAPETRWTDVSMECAS